MKEAENIEELQVQSTTRRYEYITKEKRMTPYTPLCLSSLNWIFTIQLKSNNVKYFQLIFN